MGFNTALPICTKSVSSGSWLICGIDHDPLGHATVWLRDAEDERPERYARLQKERLKYYEELGIDSRRARAVARAPGGDGGKQLPARRLAGRLISRLVGAVAAGMRRIGMKPSNNRDFPVWQRAAASRVFPLWSGSTPAAGLLRRAAIRPA